MGKLSLIYAFTAGILSFFSPCIFPLLPAYVASLTGSTIQGNRINVAKKILLWRSISFILGFSVIFVLLGLSASILGQLVTQNRRLLEKIGGFLIVVFGLQMAGLLQLKFLMLEKRWEVKQSAQRNSWDSFLIGLAFGAGWTPCVGLSLSSILLLAGSTETMYSGLKLLVSYSLGLGIPFLVISLLITYSLGVITKLNRALPYLSVINGWILIAMGILLFTGQLQKISAWLASFSLYLH